MATSNLMSLKVLLPFGVFVAETGVANIIVDTSAGSMGILPGRMDCVAALGPGILVYTGEQGHAAYIAVDGGILIKSGHEVHVSVRNAVRGLDLTDLRETVATEFMVLDTGEQQLRYVMSKMENTFLQRIAVVSHG